jgi:hypothetical protein
MFLRDGRSRLRKRDDGTGRSWVAGGREQVFGRRCLGERRKRLCLFVRVVAVAAAACIVRIRSQHMFRGFARAASWCRGGEMTDAPCPVRLRVAHCPFARRLRLNLVWAGECWSRSAPALAFFVPFPLTRSSLRPGRPQSPLSSPYRRGGKADCIKLVSLRLCLAEPT